MNSPLPVVPRIRRYSVVDPATDCWNWKRKLTHEGYGHMTVRNKTCLAHRASYEAFVGPIPHGLTIDHLCGNPSCVNPAHLEPVTMKENLARGNSFSAVNAKKTHCNSGHPLSGTNLYLCKGRRQCRRCNAAAVARRKARLVSP